MKDYAINPVLMKGIVKSAADGSIRINLRGRLGVITVTEKFLLPGSDVAEGREAEMYFSYVNVCCVPAACESSDLFACDELFPVLLSGKITIVNDTAIQFNIMDTGGTISVPRRWVFTDEPLKKGLTAEFYFSRVRVKNKEEKNEPNN